jgi:Tol biopolymer transport system component
MTRPRTERAQRMASLMAFVAVMIALATAWGAFALGSASAGSSQLAVGKVGWPVLVSTIDPSSEYPENSDIFLLQPDGAVERLTSYAGPDHSPSWSPDRGAIAFVSDRDEAGNVDVYVMQSDGSHVRRITTSKAIETGPSWSPSGDLLAFERTDDAGRTTVIGIDLTTGEERPLSPPGLDAAQPAWSPDGRELAVSVNDDGSLRILVIAPETAGTRDLSKGFASISGPEWAGPGTITVAVHINGDFGNEIQDMSAQDGTPTSVILSRAAGIHVMSHVWSPDGQQLAYMYVSESDPMMVPRLAIHDAASGGTVELEPPSGLFLPLFDW